VGDLVDLSALGVLAIAILRGLWIGLVREVFSIGALAAAVLAFRALRAPAAEMIAARTTWDPLIATAAGGGIVVIAALVFVTFVGLIVRRVVGAAGLGAIDRIGGAALGAGEGALVVGLALLAVTEILGPQDPLVAGSRALSVFERVQEAAGVEPERRATSSHAPADAAVAPTPGRPSGRGGGSDR
jgi:membrane protein required for colicin V production